MCEYRNPLRARFKMVFALLTLSICAATTVAAQRERDLPNGEHLELYVGQSRIVRAPWSVARVSVTDPNVASIQVLTMNQVLLSGLSPGTTDFLMWNEKEEVTHSRLTVEIDTGRIETELLRLFPDGRFQAFQSGDVLVISGSLRRADQAQQMHRYLEATGVMYVDMTSVAGVQQVQLQVRIAEVSRQALRALGVNGFVGGSDFFGGVTIGPFGGGALNPLNVGPPMGAPATTNIPFSFTSDTNISQAVTLFGGFPRADLQFFVQALADNQYLRILAEPNLVAVSGETASFLAGGEFPIPVVQGSTVGAGTSITIEYKEFGVRLMFKPTVLGDGAIRMHVAPEVSELSDQGAVQIQGFRVPSIVTRRSETTLELYSGQTFAMAGLLSKSSRGISDRVPGAGDVPILGSLFRSVRYEEGHTELVVLVTASLVEPLSLDSTPPLPGAQDTSPNDWELYAAGQIEGMEPATLSPDQEAWLQELGFHQLKGPGAWETPGQPPAASRALAPRPEDESRSKEETRPVSETSQETLIDMASAQQPGATQ